VGWCGLDVSGSGYRSVIGPCQHGNELLGPTKGGDLLD
jgi:hypothetical protein